MYAVGKVQEFTDGMDFAAFTADDKTVYAVIRAVEIMGEATNRTSRDVLNRHPDIPWSNIVGMRNIVIHNYDKVDLEAVWQVVVWDAPRLVAILTTDQP